MEAVAIMVGGAILTPLFESLLDSLKSNDMFTYARGSKVLEEVNEWKPTLEAILAVLDDAEKQRRTDGVVNSWFKDLRDLAYDVDDVVDELITHAAQREFRAQTETRVEKLLRCGMSFSGVKFSVGMVSKVKDVSRRLEGIKKRMELQNNALGRNMRVNEEITARPSPTSSLVEPKVRGREDDYKAVVDMMKSKGGDGGISVICIVGMGGVGKTTLAQMLYDDNSLQFDFRAWVSIGEDFDLITATKKIVQSEGDLDSVQTKLREKLSGKRFLVVLDDLWSEDYNKWTRFYLPFASGASGSRIIITTRNNKVSSRTSTGDGSPLTYHLEILSNDDCLSLFAHHALGQEDFSQHGDLKEVGQEIVKKCKGLPLAAKAIGGLLRGSTCLNEWKKLLEDKSWEEKSEILPALRLSYYNLPHPLKRCFSYCAIFPKEYEFNRGDLVLLWLAEGFLPNLSEGYVYFDELFARSFFQKSAEDASRFLMHDLINDLARSVSGGVCLNLDEEKKAKESYAQVRHLAYNRGRYDIAPRFEFFQHTNFLRTILALPMSDEWTYHCISSKILDVWIPKLKCLKVLSLFGYERVELSKSLSNLQHLRYLNLCGSKIKTLPTSISKLFNLQILILRYCNELRELPEDFCNLINLQCIDLRCTEMLEKMPLYIGNLQKLHILTKFIVGNIDGSGIQELLKIPNLQGHVHIKELQNVFRRDYLRIKEKEKIDELVLEWSSDFEASRDEENEKQVLEALQPQKNLGRMSIKSYGGREFPSWLCNESFKMTVVKIHNCRNVSSLPPLGGLPSLKALSIGMMPGVEQVGVEFYGEVSSSSFSNVFPSLEILKFKGMENWRRWGCIENVEYKGHIFPKLKKLGIRSCPGLVGYLPKCLHSLEELVIEKCKAEVLNDMPKLEALTKLEISYISGLVSLNVEFPETFKSLQVLEVVGCDELQHLWENGTKIESLGSLTSLKIQYCLKLVSVVGEEEILPPNLQFLGILRCENLERLPNELNNLKSLTTLRIIGCQKLTTIGDMPKNLKEVEIEGCDSLVRIEEGIMVDENEKSSNGQTSRIENLTLHIVKSESPIIPSNVVFPTSLKDLSIYGGLETQLLGSLKLQNHLSHLTTLRLDGCLLESFPASGLPIPTLLNLKLSECKNLISLPCNFHDLTSLTTLHLCGCPKLECCPGREMPTKLSSLEIYYCDTLERKPMSEWRLDRIPLLQDLIIAGAMEMVSSFPHHSLPLPTSLTHLFINGFQNLRSISSDLKTLTSLQGLTFFSCPKLQYLPKEGLPPSLGELSFWYCPFMKKQCKTKYRSHLAHIPNLEIEEVSVNLIFAMEQ